MEEKPAIRREGSPDPRTWLGRNLFAQATRFTQLCAAAAFFIAVSAVAGWLFDARFLAGQWRQYVPMAPSSALAFLLLSSGVFSHARGPGRPLVRSFELAAAGLPALLGLLVLAQSFAGFDSGVERLLSRTNEQLGQVRLGRMSPLTAVTFLLEGAALMLLLRATRWRFAAAAAALFASTGAAINLVVSLGYSYGVPLLYGGATIPVALPTALAFVLLGAGELKLALPGVPLLRAWSGDSVRGGLLRAFLPGVLVLIFFEGWLDAVMVTPEALNPALWQSLKGLVACILIVCLTAWTARRTGDAMERAEKEWRESREFLQAVIDGTADVIYAKDRHGRYLMLNRAAERFTGKSAAEVLGRDDTFLYPPTEAAAMMEADRKVLETGATLTYEKEITSAGGRPTAFLSTKGPLLDAGGGLRGLFCIARDITDRKQADAKLLQAQKMESIGRLAGGVAHDFNNVLTVINGYSEMMLDTMHENDPLRVGLTEIHNAGARAAGLTQQLLAFSRRQVLRPRVLDLNQVVDGMRSMLNRLVGEDVEVRVELNAQDARVRADQHQLEQVVMNLVVNSRDAMPQGGKLLIETGGVVWDESYLRLHPEARPGRYVRLAVSDNGAGMDEVTRRHIFEPFFTTKGIGQGTGLGLSMVQGIVAQSGGYIEVYSELGRGTTFKIYLPEVEEETADVETAAPLPGVTGTETVLVVEDQAEVREYVAAALKAFGYQVIQAENPVQAQVLCAQEGDRIRLVLTDVVMPGLSGRELANRLLKLLPAVKLLFMSGYTDEAITLHGVLAEGAQFIQKPFSPRQLAAKVREVLGP